MDYDTVLRKVNGFGNYQKIFSIMVSLASVFNGMTPFAVTFAFGEHEHRCRLPDHDDHYTPPGHVVFNTTNGIQSYNVSECHIQYNGTISGCKSWLYDQSLYTATIISKFDVVCDKKFFRAHFLMSQYLGCLFGSLFAGVFSDTFGRKPVLSVGIIMILVSMGIRPLIPNLMLVTVLEFFNGVGSMIAYLSPFLLLTEMVGPGKRLLVSFILNFIYCLGNYALLLMAYFIRDWSLLYYAITIVVGAYAIVLFFISESPRWLISRGHTKEAIDILEKMARFNGRTIHLSDSDIIVKSDHRMTFCTFVRQMFSSKTLMYRLSVICLNWYAVTMTYYGISMNVAKFSGDIFVNFAISSSAEVVGICLCLFYTNRIGRKRLFSSSMILSGLMCMCTIFTALYAGDSQVWLTTSLAMLGRFFNGIAFFVVYMFTAELFPTVLRASVFGISSTAGRLGSISSAYVGELETVIPTKFGIALPLIILGSIGFVAGLLSLTLPETTNTLLPENIKDARNITIADRSSGSESQELSGLNEKMGEISFEPVHTKD